MEQNAGWASAPKSILNSVIASRQALRGTPIEDAKQSVRQY